MVKIGQKVHSPVRQLEALEEGLEHSVPGLDFVLVGGQVAVDEAQTGVPGSQGNRNCPLVDAQSSHSCKLRRMSSWIWAKNACWLACKLEGGDSGVGEKMGSQSESNLSHGHLFDDYVVCPSGFSDHFLQNEDRQ